MPDQLAPFQIKCEDSMIWLENELTGTKGGKFVDTPYWRAALRKVQARLNSSYGLDQLGIN